MTHMLFEGVTKELVMAPKVDFNLICKLTDAWIAHGESTAIPLLLRGVFRAQPHQVEWDILKAKLIKARETFRAQRAYETRRSYMRTYMQQRRTSESV